MISAAHLTRRFGNRVAVDDLTVEIRPSEIVALLGPNGAGKTTTLRMLAGLIAPTSGSVAIDGTPLTAATGSALRKRIGFLTEAPGLWDRLSVRENLAVYAGLYGIADSDRAIDRVLDTIDLRGRASTRAAELSKGMRQKTALARALLHDPAILLLDEPTSGLDPEVTRTVRQLLRERRDSGGAILVSTHNLDEAERIADRVVVLQGRLVAAGTASELRRRLITGRVLVRVAGDPRSYLAVARGFDAAASADDATLTVAIGDDIEHRTPALVAALVAAGAAILEVRQEIPALEDVYLHLVGRR